MLPGQCIGDCDAPITTITRLNNTAVSSINAARYEEAGKFFRRALNNARQHTFFDIPEPKPSLTTVEVSKSLYIYQRGEYDEGMHSFSNPIKLDESLCSMHSATSTILYNLGQLFLRINDNEEASNSFMRALQIAEWSGEDQPRNSQYGVSIMAILHCIGHVQYRSGHYEDAVRTYAKALHLGKNSYSKSTHNMLDVATTLNCLGVLYFHLPKADTEKAMQLYLESLAIRKSVTGDKYESVEIATTLNNVGRIHYMKGEHDKALSLYREALRIRRKLLGDEHLDVAATVYNAGQTYHQKGELGAAMKLYQEFLRIARQRLGAHHRDVAIMLKCMAQIHHERKEYDNAAKLYEEALVVGKAALGNCHPEVRFFMSTRQYYFSISFV